MSIACVFPGQGSQEVGMLASLAAEYPEVQNTFAEASSVLGYDLWAVTQQGPKEKLDQTEITQPALLSAGVAVWRVLLSRGLQTPAYLAGHSLGEYSALVCAQSLAFTDALLLVAERGRLMQQAVPVGVGAMAAVLGLDDEQVIDVCRQAAQTQVVSAVNFNTPGQVVIAGHKEAIERAMALAKDAGAKRALLLPVSVPSHCALMKPAAEQLDKIICKLTIKSPVISVIHNIDASVHTQADAIRKALVEQLYNPVQWVKTVQTLAASGVAKIIETGPGKVLQGLNKRIDAKVHTVSAYDPATLKAALKMEELTA